MDIPFSRYTEKLPEEFSVRHKITETTEKRNFHLHRQMEIIFAPTDVHIGIAGVFLFGALVVGLNVPDLWSFVLGKAENGILRLAHTLSLLFCQVRS